MTATHSAASAAVARPDWRLFSNTPANRLFGPHGIRHTAFDKVNGTPIEHEPAPVIDSSPPLAITKDNFATVWTGKPTASLSPDEYALTQWQMHKDNFPEYSNIAELTADAYALATASADHDIVRLHDHLGRTHTIHIPTGIEVTAMKNGLLVSVFRAIDQNTGNPNGAQHWQRLLNQTPPVGLRELSDHPVAIAALSAQATKWRLEGMPEENLARNLLKMRRGVEHAMHLVAGPMHQALKETNQLISNGEKFGPKYTFLKETRGFTDEEIADIALSTTGGHFARPARLRGAGHPTVQWATTKQFRTPAIHAAAQWIDHRLHLLEFHNIHEYMAAARDLAHAMASFTVLQKHLSWGGRVVRDAENNRVLVENLDGLPVTFFRPQNGDAFWEQISHRTTLEELLDYGSASVKATGVQPGPQNRR